MNKKNESKEEQFFLNNFNIDTLFRSVERTDYYFLHYIRMCANQLEPDGKMYLSKLAKTIGISMPELSKAIQNLQDKGYLIWKTDSDAGRTFVELTSKAVELMSDQQERMRKGYEAVLNEIGNEELERTIQTMKKIKRIIEHINEDEAEIR